MHASPGGVQIPQLGLQQTCPPGQVTAPHERPESEDASVVGADASAAASSPEPEPELDAELPLELGPELPLDVDPEPLLPAPDEAPASVGTVAMKVSLPHPATAQQSTGKANRTCKLGMVNVSSKP